MSHEEAYINNREKHVIAHTMDYLTKNPLPYDRACTICHPPLGTPDSRFQKFWNWVKANYLVISYSELSKTYLNNLTQALADSNFEVASRLSTELVLSLGFNSIFNFKAVQTQICLTINRTNGFEKDPSTITTATLPTMTTISADQLTAILTQVNNSLGTALAGVTVNATVTQT